MWSGIGIAKAGTEGRSPNCFMSYVLIAKLAHFFTLSVFEMTPFQPLHFISAHCDYCDVILLHCSTNKSIHVATMGNGRGDGKGWDSWKPALIKFIINTIPHSLGCWPTIVLYFIQYKKKTTFIWCAVCGQIVPHTGDPQQIITKLCIYLKSR